MLFQKRATVPAFIKHCLQMPSLAAKCCLVPRTCLQVGGPKDANGWPLLVEAVDLCFSGTHRCLFAVA